MANLGYSFAPTQANADQAKASPPFGAQGAIKTLSYQLPKVTGAAGGGLSPLVGSEQHGSGITSAVLQSVLRAVFGPEGDRFMNNSDGDFAAGLAGLAGQNGHPGQMGGSDHGFPPSSSPPVIHPGDIRGGGSDVGPIVDGPPMYDAPSNPGSHYQVDPVINEPQPRGPDTFAGGMDREHQMNGRSPIMKETYANATGAPPNFGGFSFMFHR